jgi:hypothetical protein
MQMDGWTDMMKLIVTFCNFANTPTNLFSPNMAFFIDNLIKVFPVPYSHSSKLDIMPLPHPSYDQLILLLSVAKSLHSSHNSPTSQLHQILLYMQQVPIILHGVIIKETTK